LTLRQRQPREKNDKHLDFIRSLPCLVCGDNTSTEAAHIRMADLRAGKQSTGMAQKPHDRFTVPLCGECHRKQHDMNEVPFWHFAGIDPIFVALALFCISGDHQAGVQIIEANR
jgi:hypothetical protein